MRKTKIICTIGPSSNSRKMIEKFILNGMDVARINTSHSTQEEAKKIIRLIRELSGMHRKETAIMLDLQGPKIRIGILEKEIHVEPGQEVIFTIKSLDAGTIEVFKEAPIIKVDYENILNDIENGSSIFIDDGAIECRVLEIDRELGIARSVVVRGGVIRSRKGINLPGVKVSEPSVTERDLVFLQLGIDEKVDFIAQSFIRTAFDIKKVRDILKENKSHIMIVAKIEKNEAVHNFESILKQADAVMVARGDLGIEMPEEEVPNIQKEIIRKANSAGKPVITATQMLDSMMRNPRPTRAEVSDVANAIYDGSDAVMLSGETAAGKYPLEALSMIVKIINSTEKNLHNNALVKKPAAKSHSSITEAISFAATEVADILNARVIICITQSGSTARHISKNRPESIIVGTSPHQWVVKQLMISWGVLPELTMPAASVEEMISEAMEASKNLGLVCEGDNVVITGGLFANKPGSTNFINVREVD